MTFSIHHKLTTAEIEALTKRAEGLYERRTGMAPEGSRTGLAYLAHHLAGDKQWRRVCREITGQPSLDWTGRGADLSFYAGAYLP